MSDRIDFDPPIRISPESISTWMGYIDNVEAPVQYVSNEGHNVRTVTLTTNQVRALAYGGTDQHNCLALLTELATSFDKAAEVEAGGNHGDIVIDAWIPEEGALLVNYAWNAENCGPWLEADGGLHYQPDETGFYPWRDNV